MRIVRSVLPIMVAGAWGCFSNPAYVPPTATSTDPTTVVSGSGGRTSTAGKGVSSSAAGTSARPPSAADTAGATASASVPPAAGSDAPETTGQAGAAPTPTAGTAAPDPTPTAGTAATDPSAPAAGTSAADPPQPAAGAAAGEVAGASGGGAGAPAIALQCPMEACEALPPPPEMASTMGYKVMQCCADNGQCGTAMNDAACIATPDSDPQCPSLQLMGFTIPSCCTAESKCGINFAAFMRDCTSNEDLKAMAGSFITVPDPASCVPATPGAPSTP